MFVRLVFIGAGPLVSAWWYIEVGPTEFSNSIGMPGGNDKTTKGEALGLDNNNVCRIGDMSRRPKAQMTITIYARGRTDDDCWHDGS